MPGKEVKNIETGWTTTSLPYNVSAEDFYGEEFTRDVMQFVENVVTDFACETMEPHVILFGNAVVRTFDLAASVSMNSKDNRSQMVVADNLGDVYIFSDEDDDVIVFYFSEGQWRCRSSTILMLLNGMLKEMEGK